MRGKWVNNRRKRSLVVVLAVLIVAMLMFGISELRKYQKENSTCDKDCNVLLISIDSVSADHLSAYGYYRNTSPNFDKLAKQGTLFKSYYSTSFLTPISEASVHTGLYPTSNGITNFDVTLPESRTMLAQYMQKLGYRTQAISSSPEFAAWPALKASFIRGYDSFKNPNAVKNATLASSRQYPSIEEVTKALGPDIKNNKPGFLWLPLGGVHWPFGVNSSKIWTNSDYNGTLAKSDLSIALFMNTYDGYVYPNTTQKIKLTDEDKQYIVDNYDDGIRAFDDYLGKIIAYLKNSKLDKKTIIIIQSEHGEAMGEHGYYAHYDVQDNQTHVPLLIVDPRIKGGKQISSMTSSVDILPTVLNLLGTSSDNGVQGKSLVPLINGSEKDGQRNTIYIERTPLWEEAVLLPEQDSGILATTTGAKDIAVRTDKWKYILRLSSKRQEEISVWARLTQKPIKIPPAELYNLKSDPGEKKNVIEQYPGVAAQLKKQLEDWYTKAQASAPQNVKKSNVLQPYQ